MAEERRWRSAPADHRIATPLDSLTALFDRASGQTHLLASPLPEILAALDDGPADVETLLLRLAARFDLAAEDAETAVVARLEELEQLGLVERA